MRCKCCDSKETRLWKGDYYCAPCRASIAHIIEEDKDDHSEKITSYKWGDPVDLVHKRWDDD